MIFRGRTGKKRAATVRERGRWRPHGRGSSRTRSRNMSNQPFDPEQLRRWRLILGKASDECLGGMCGTGMCLSAADAEMDQALAAIYDETAEDAPNQRSAGLGASSPRLAKW